jgi:hypothetical protein
MKKTIGILLVATLTLTACGRVRDSAINPFNWFGRAETVETEAEEINPLIPQERESIFRQGEPEYAGSLVAELTTLRIERVAGGAIIRVKAIAATQGAFDVRLEPENEDQEPVKGVLTYSLLAVQPPGYRQGPAQSREITAAVFRTDQDLSNVRTIRVVGANKTLQSRR